MSNERRPGTRKLSIPPLPADAKVGSEWDDEDRLTRIYDRGSKAPPPMFVLEPMGDTTDEVTTAANVAPAELEALRVQLRLMEEEARKRASALLEPSPQRLNSEAAPMAVPDLRGERSSRRILKWLAWTGAAAAIGLGALAFPSLSEVRQLLPLDHKLLRESLVHYARLGAVVPEHRLVVDRKSAREAPVGTGVLRINARPWAQVYVDGKLVGHTPQMNIELPAGWHRISLRNAELDLSRTFPINILTGKVETRIVEL